MFWKKWPYWLKIGIIFGTFGVLLGGLGVVCSVVMTGWDSLRCVYFFRLPIELFGEHVLDSAFTIFWGQFATFFAVGAIVGFIFDSFKFLKNKNIK